MIVSLTRDIYGIIVDDFRKELFEGLWPIPSGISYNAYVIAGDEPVLIEGGVSQGYAREFLEELEELVEISSISHVIVNHMEPDHTGTLPLILSRSKAMVHVSPMGKKLLRAFYGFDDESRIKVERDGSVLRAGEWDIEFYSVAGAHWPDSMVSYNRKEKILFSSDVFGAFGATRGVLYDDEIEDITSYFDEVKRYFVNIIGKFVGPVKRALQKISGLEIKTIAPAHGIIWRTNPERIIEFYRELVSGNRDRKVVIAYSTMYGFTERAAWKLAREIRERGLNVKVFNLQRDHPSYVLSELWEAEALVLGVPTYDNGPHPPIRYLVELIMDKKIEPRKYGIFGTYGWSGKGYRLIADILNKAGWMQVGPVVEINGKLDESGKKLEELATNLSSG